MNSKTKLELLAPAGDMECLKMAIKGGADAVYLGGKSFGARALATNFDHAQMIEAIDLCHLNGIKIYVTINTMLYEYELQNALKEVEFLYQNGVDALIVSDIGLIDTIRQMFPDIEIHVSTQAHIHNAEAAKNMMRLGVDRLVLARELSLAKIKEIASLDIETEVFVHGAICISYSGQCLMGSVLHDRSGNRGLCSQCCRMRYRLYDEDDKKFIKTKGDYLLSPRDLFLLDEIPSIIEAGIDSIKIEGRMKRPEYVGYVTSVYRRAIDAYYDGLEFKIDKTMIDDLKLLFNRGFTEGYFKSENTKDIMNPLRPNHIGIKIGEVIDQRKGKLYVRLFDDLDQNDGLRIIDGDSEYGLVAGKIYQGGLLVNGAKAKEIVSFDYRDLINKDALVYKTTSVKLMNKIATMSQARKIKVDICYKAKHGEAFLLKISDRDNEVIIHGDIVQKANKRPLSRSDIERQLSKLNDTAYTVDRIYGEVDDAFIAVSALNEYRRQAVKELNERRIGHKDRRHAEYKRYELKEKTYPPYVIEVQSSDQLKACQNFKKLEAIYITRNSELAKNNDGIYYIASNVNENGQYSTLHQTVSEYGGIKKGDVIYPTLNVANSHSVAHFMSFGARAIILSYEINDEMANALVEAFYRDYGFIPCVYLYTYGKRDLMYLKRSPVYDGLADIDIEHDFSLVDLKGSKYHLDRDHDKTCIIESKSALLHRPKNFGKFVKFYDEGPGKVNEIIHKLLIQD